MQFDDQHATTTAQNGRWRVDLPPLPAGGPHTLTIAGATNRVELHDILVGEVYLCSGQSNMGFNLQASVGGPEAAAASADPMLRLYSVPLLVANTPQTEVKSHWVAASPQTTPPFSAVAYYFGRKLRAELRVPVGLIKSEWGGTVAEAWTSAEGLRSLPQFAPAIETLGDSAPGSDPNVQFERRLTAWYAKHDPGMGSQNWAAPDLDDSGWKTMNLPQLWEHAGVPELETFDGLVWFRRSFDLPADWVGEDLVVHLGQIDDYDSTFLNGQLVGSTADNWLAPREYRLPAALLHPGRNVLAVRVLDTAGEGGIGGPLHVEMKLVNPVGGAPLPLSGAWRYKIAAPWSNAEPAPRKPGINPNIPTVLYNAMIAPLIPYGIRGAIWYQGESNAARALEYRQLLPAMIADWRGRWAEGDFPFYLVQLAPFMKIVQEPPPRSDWALLRETQRQISLTVPQTGMAVITDVGDENDIHPRRKEPVGDRLALLALANVYQKPVECSGPAFESMRVEGDKAVLRFSHAVGLTVKGGGTLTGFTLAGDDRRYVNAEAAIAGDAVVVSAPGVAHPAAVRFGWANYPLVNLYNGAGLPASPFQTDPYPEK